MALDDSSVCDWITISYNMMGGGGVCYVASAVTHVFYIVSIITRCINPLSPTEEWSASNKTVALNK